MFQIFLRRRWKNENIIYVDVYEFAYEFPKYVVYTPLKDRRDIF